MDPLRLLTRSTKFSKKPSAPPRQIPSTGPATNPQLYDNASSTQKGNLKRKRGSNDTTGVPAITQSLDFFGGSFAQSAQSKDSAKSGHDEPVTTQAEATEDSVGAAQATMTKEECKQILGRHKLKITLFRTLGSQEGDLSVSKKKKISKTTPVSARSRTQALHPAPAVDFQGLRQRFGLSKALCQNIQDQGYRTTTEVQLGALPLLLGSRVDLMSAQDADDTEQSLQLVGEDQAKGPLDIDLLTVAPTGSGKTLAFMISVIHSLLYLRHQQKQAVDGPQAIILAPTKELSSQIANEGRKLAQNTGIRITNVRKGMHLSKENSAQTDGSNKEIPPVKADVLVSTPAALLNAIGDVNENASSLANIRFLVLDEADVLLDPLFKEQTLGVWNHLNNPRLRVSFWSATMGSNIEELVKITIQARKDRLTASEDAYVEAPLVRLVVGLKDSAVPNIDHQLIYAASEQGKLMALRQLLHPTSTGADKQPVLRAPFLVFVQTIERAVALHSELMYDIPPEAGGISRIAVLHSDLSETARDRIMTRFRKGEVWILITTDLLSRGVDFRGVNGVVNYDVPNSAAAYVHRVGRTGRAGREGGVALTYYTDEDVASIKTVANIIAASQKQRGVSNSKQGVQQWLLDALPTPSKRDKQQLKKRGLEARRSTAGKDSKTSASKTRISTKSGYIRKMENNRRGAIAARQAGPSADSDGESFGGFES
ncbi:hypothetical protein MBLNU459_g4570t1 [Dothideomycetes sp. NU459]